MGFDKYRRHKYQTWRDEPPGKKRKTVVEREEEKHSKECKKRRYKYDF